MRARQTWWLWPAAAAFFGYFALLSWSALGGPADPGFELAFGPSGISVVSLRPGAASRAGFRAADRIVAAGGLRPRTRLDWRVVAANWEAGRAEPFTVERDGRVLQLTMFPDSRDWEDWRSPGAIVPWILLLLRLATLLLAIGVAWRARGNAAALAGAWFLASSAVCTVAVLNGYGALWRGLPVFAAAALFVPAVSAVLLGPVFFTFFSLFPRPLFRRRTLLLAAWIPALFELRWFAAFLYRLIYTPRGAIGIVPGGAVGVYAATFLAYLAAGVSALVIAYRNTDDAAGKRRIRLLALGAILGWAAVIPLIASDWLGPDSSLTPEAYSGPVAIAAGTVFLACMFALAYALVRRRVFGIGVLVRQGIRYALARNTVLALAPAVLVWMLADIISHGDQPLMAIVRERGWIYGLLALLALAAQSRRQRWLDALDRRFFREHYDAQRLLRTVVEEIGRAGGVREIGMRSVALIEAALHPEYVALLLREASSPSYRVLALAPSGAAPPVLPAANKITTLARLLEKPVEIPHSTRSWLSEQLPASDIDAVRQARIDLLVPVRAGEADAFLVLGSKRSEEPYTAEDRELLTAIATGFGLLLERGERARTSSFPPSSMMMECPHCGGCFDSGIASCPADSASLEPRRIPRVLAGRYRVDRRIGRGGMGTVYQATDVALDRAVAAKVIHDHLVGSPEAAERFRREARAAASFSHPNIVVVHDYGVFSERHAFLIMELLQGATLRQEMLGERAMLPRRAVDLLRGVCDAVETAHRRDIIHRDLKPENIFITSTDSGEVPKVLDFGLAKSVRAFAATTAATQTAVHTESGVLIGTLRYMSPEQLLGQIPSPSWDVWALSVMTYEMLAGAYPFQQMTPADWRAAILSGNATPITAHIPDASPQLQGFFRRAFSSALGQRPPSARRFFEDIERTLN